MKYGQLLDDAEKLKQNIWSFIDEDDDKNQELKDTMNYLLDLLEDLE